MATAIKKCRVCGKDYEACHTVSRVAGVFRWQEVACSPECGSTYLSRIETSRNVTSDKHEEDNNQEFHKAEQDMCSVQNDTYSVVDDIYDDDDDDMFDEEYDEDLDDDDEE